MAVETYLHWHQKLSSRAPMLIERCLWLRLPKFQSPFCVTSAGGHLMRETQLSKMSVSLKSCQKLLPRFLRVPPISEEKSFTNLAASSRPFEETEYQVRSGVPVVTPSVSDEF